jgi:pimeloyl-ACP methyl ester carboxylesterase
MSSTPPMSGYAPVNGLRMYFEIHGEERGGRPLVLLHGGLSGIGTSFGQVLPAWPDKGRSSVSSCRPTGAPATSTAR